MSQTHPGFPTRPPRLFPGDKILKGEVNLDAYPFRYVAVAGIGVASNEALDMVLTAVEFLETRGWELVNLAAQESVVDFIAVLRRP